MHSPSKPVSPAARRHSVAVAAVCAGTVLGLLATTGVAAAAPAEPASTAPTSARTIAAPVVEALTPDTGDALSTLDRAESALVEAAAVAAAIDAAGPDLGLADTAIDTGPLRDAIGRLSDADVVPVPLFPRLAEDAASQTRDVTARASELRTRLDAAEAQRAAEEAAAEAQRQAEAAAAAAAAAEAQRGADALAAANTPDGAKVVAQQLAADEYGWGSDQFSCLTSLWQRESNWNYQAYNASSGATGIPQALPGSKMASAGADWATNAATQIAWGLDYISRAYGSPCGAWGKSQSSGWY